MKHSMHNAAKTDAYERDSRHMKDFSVQNNSHEWKEVTYEWLRAKTS